ncbi:hypothetical protein [Bacillus sp. Marseille-P3661]|uniref:hypothetical protein n=1 Tax=Bacillus sp. Marseille-P3661 TaxID=1936234 RepID=UPI000C845C4D|nr:hypothetical protein [Bacillus sp. Marseille-P3661]
MSNQKKINPIEIYTQGFNDGLRVGYDKGFKHGAIEGVEATLNQLGKEAAKSLRNGNGNDMAFYRKFKTECNSYLPK